VTAVKLQKMKRP